MEDSGVVRRGRERVRDPKVTTVFLLLLIRLFYFFFASGWPRVASTSWTLLGLTKMKLDST